MEPIGEFIRIARLKAGITQQELADWAGVGIRLIRDLEQGVPRSVRVDKLNQILAYFGYELAPVPLKKPE